MEDSVFLVLVMNGLDKSFNSASPYIDGFTEHLYRSGSFCWGLELFYVYTCIIIIIEASVRPCKLLWLMG